MIQFHVPVPPKLGFWVYLLSVVAFSSRKSVRYDNADQRCWFRDSLLFFKLLSLRPLCAVPQGARALAFDATVRSCDRIKQMKESATEQGRDRSASGGESGSCWCTS